MATASIRHEWADGSATEMFVDLDENFPDAAAEVVARVIDLYRAACTDEAER
jgi:hypothetical protein